MEQNEGYLHCNIINQTLSIQGKRFPALCALFLSHKLREAIQIQLYKPWWVPLTAPYLAYKKKKGWSTDTWKATGYLQSRITTYWSGSKNSWISGIKPKDKHPGGRQWKQQRNVTKNRRNISVSWLISTKDTWYTLQIARTLEYGSRNKNIPARPLFRTTYNNFMDTLSKLNLES